MLEILKDFAVVFLGSVHPRYFNRSRNASRLRAGESMDEATTHSASATGGVDSHWDEPSLAGEVTKLVNVAENDGSVLVSVVCFLGCFLLGLFPVSRNFFTGETGGTNGVNHTLSSHRRFMAERPGLEPGHPEGVGRLAICSATITAPLHILGRTKVRGGGLCFMTTLLQAGGVSQGWPL